MAIVLRTLASALVENWDDAMAIAACGKPGPLVAQKLVLPSPGFAGNLLHWQR